MQYIRDHEAEQLLEKYRDLRGMIQNTRIQMQNVIENSKAIDDDILAAALPHIDFDSTPSYSPGAVTDKTARIAIEYENSLSIETKKALKELRSELLLLEVVADKIDTALSAIPIMQKDILAMRYCEKLVFAEIADKLFVSTSKVKQRRKDALERFSKVSRITMDEFEAVLKLFD